MYLWALMKASEKLNKSKTDTVSKNYDHEVITYW